MKFKPITLDQMRTLPVPSLRQQRRFARHLCDVHSWYKHLPLLTGGTFLVYLSPHAGEDYPLQHPRLPFGNTVTGYRRAFGHLDYVYSTNGMHFYHDGTALESIRPSDLPEGCRLVLYPYVSSEFYWSAHEEALDALLAGAPHPRASTLLEYARATRDAGEAEQRLSTLEEQAPGDDESLRAARREHHLLSKCTVDLHESLRLEESAKVWGALVRLGRCLHAPAASSK